MVLDRLDHLDSIGGPVTRPSSAPRSSPSSTSRRGDEARSATACTSARSPVRPGSMSTSPCSSARPKDSCRRGRPSTRCSATWNASSPGWRDRRSGPPSSTASSWPSARPPPRSRSPCPAATCGRRRRTTSRAGSLHSSPPPVRATSSSTPMPTGWRPRSSPPRPPSTGCARCGRAHVPATTSATCRSPTTTSICGGPCGCATPGPATGSPSSTATSPPARSTALPATISPTRVETWAGCPHAYFVQYVLGARPIDEPADIETLSPLDRGTAIHDAIDRLHREVLAGTLPQPGPDRLDGRARRRACSVPAPRWPTPSTPPGARAELRSGSTPGPSCSARSTPGWPSTASAGPDGRCVVRAGVRRATSVSSWSCRTGVPSASAARSTASTSCPTARSSSPTTRRASRTSSAASPPTTRRWPAGASSSRSTPPRPAPCSGRRRRLVLAGYTYFKPKFARAELVLDDDVEHPSAPSWRVSSTPSSRGSSRLIPEPPGWVLLQRVLVLRSRRTRHGAGVGELGAQAVRRRARRAVPARRRGAGARWLSS